MTVRNVKEGTLFAAQSMGSDITSSTLDPEDYFTLTLSVSWAGANASDANLFPEISTDGTLWSKTPSNYSYVIDAAESVQLFVYQYINFKYFRLRYVHNSVTTGTITVSYRLSNERD